MTSNTTKALTWSIILVFGTIGVTIAALINGDRQDEEQNTLMYENETIKNEFRALSELVTSLPQHLSFSISQSLNSLLSLLPLREHGRSF